MRTDEDLQMSETRRDVQEYGAMKLRLAAEEIDNSSVAGSLKSHCTGASLHPMPIACSLSVYKYPADS